MTYYHRDARWAWRQLGIAATGETAEIRRAYAKRLKAIDVDSDPQAFIDLREALEIAKRAAARRARPSIVEATLAPPPDSESAPSTGEIGFALLEADPSATPLAVTIRPARDNERAPAVEADPSIRPTSTTETAPVEVHPTPDPVTVTIADRTHEEPVAPEQMREEVPDAALFARIEALLLGPPGEDTGPELRSLTEALLADPSLEQLRVAGAVENWLADVISRSAPRSDPMLAPTAKYFGWVDKSEEWRAPPVLGWMVQRQRDLEFEQALVAKRPRFGPVLELLRTPEVHPPTSDQVWRHAADVRDFAQFARLYHRTSIDCCDPEVRQWWEEYFRNESDYRRQIDHLRRLWRRGIPRALQPPVKRDFSVSLFLGILFLPPIFSWTLLRRGHSALGRISAAVWFALWVFVLLQAEPPPPYKPDQRLFALPVADPDLRHYRNVEEDLDPVFLAISEDRFRLADLRTRNSQLHANLVSRWQQALRSKELRARFSEDAGELMDQAYRRGVNAGDLELQTAYWRIYADKLRWFRSTTAGPAGCVSFIDGDMRLRSTLPLVLVRRERRILTRVLFEAPSSRATGTLLSTFPISERLLEATAQRAGLDHQTTRMALDARGTAVERCGARIALIESALELPRAEVEQFLRNLSAGL